MPNFIVMPYQMGKYLNQTLIYQDIIQPVLLAWDVFEIKSIRI